MVDTVKITPNMELPDLARQLNAVKKNKNLPAPTYILDDDGVRIIYGKPASSSKDELEVDQDKILFGLKSNPNKGTTYRQYAEMKAKSMLFDLLCKKSSEENAALVFSILEEHLFTKDSAFHGKNIDLAKKLLDKSSELDAKYFTDGLNDSTPEARQKGLLKLQHNLFVRDLKSNRTDDSVQGNATDDPQELCKELAIQIKAPKANKAPAAQSQPQQPPAASRPKESAKNQQSEASSARHAPSGNKAIRSDTPDCEVANPKEWHATFDVPWGKDGIYAYKNNLAEDCRWLANEINNAKQIKDSEPMDPTIKGTVNDRLNRILTSSEEQRKLESEIYKKLSVIYDGLNEEIRNGVINSDPKATEEARKQCRIATHHVLLSALHDEITESEPQFDWSAVPEDDPRWSDTPLSGTADPESWHARIGVPWTDENRSGEVAYTFNTNLAKKCRTVAAFLIEKEPDRAPAVTARLQEILRSSHERLQLETKIQEELKKRCPPPKPGDEPEAKLSDIQMEEVYRNSPSVAADVLGEALCSPPRDSEPDSIWPKNAAETLIYSNTPPSGRADPTKWSAEFKIRSPGGGGVALCFDLKASCEQADRSISERQSRSSDELSTRCRQILSSSSDRHKIQIDIQGVLKKAFQNGIADPNETPKDEVVGAIRRGIIELMSESLETPTVDDRFD